MTNLMRAICVAQAGGADELVLQEHEIPQASADEVLVKLSHIGVNFYDIYIRQGLHSSKSYPYIPGGEGAGTIVAIGDNVTHYQIGDRVAFYSSSSGAYAEYATVPRDHIIPIPEEIDNEIAAAVMMQGLTAYFLSHLTISLNSEHTVLIHAGAGGVGLLLIQMVKMLGARVISTVSTHEKMDLAKAAGADEVILYLKKPFAKQVLELTANKGVNVVYDSIGKTTFKQSLECLAVCGLLVVYGKSSGAIPAFNINLLSPKGVYLTSPALFHYANTPAARLEMASTLFDYILNKNLHVFIGQHYPLADAAQAHRDLEDRRTVGKSLLMI